MNRPSWLPERPRLPSLPGFEKSPKQEESPLAADERAYEQLEQQEQKEAFLEQAEAAPATNAIAASSQSSSPTVSAVVKDEVTIAVEKILEEGLGDYVASMPEEARLRFLYKGQETASRISVMVRTLKIQAKKVVELICDWLLTIPGVNKFFLEQEAKIKTDRILALERDYRERK